MNRTRRGFPLRSSALLFLLSACASVPLGPSGEKTARIFLSDLVKNSEKRSAVSGNLFVTTELGGRSVTMPAVLLVEFPDHLRLELQDPMGGIVALLVLNGPRAWLYMRDRPEIFTGPADKLPLSLFPTSSVEELVRVFLARPYAERLNKAALSDGKAVFREGGLLETLLWDGRVAEPEEWRRSRAGKGGLSALYEDYEFKAGLRYPTMIKLAGADSEGNQRRITLAWKDWDPSVPEEKKLFQIPQQETFGRKIKALP